MNTFEFFGLHKDGFKFTGIVKTKSSRPSKVDKLIEAKAKIRIIDCIEYIVTELGEKGYKRAWKTVSSHKNEVPLKNDVTNGETSNTKTAEA